MVNRRSISTLTFLAASVLCLTALAKSPLAAPGAVPAPASAPASVAAQSAAPATGNATSANASASANGADPRAAIAKKLPGAKVEDVRPSPVPGIFEVTRGADLVYVTADGAHAFSGDLYDLNSQTNLTERRRRDVRAQMLSGVPETQMIVFSPKDPKYTVTVFTDVDCGYCRKLHSEIAKYNELGIRVRYMFFPRSGPDTESWAKADAVWCSPDRNDAFTRAKRGEEIKSAKCGTTPVAKDYEMGQDFGIRGTPAIVLTNGELLPGYLPPALLVKRLQTANR